MVNNGITLMKHQQSVKRLMKY